MTKTKTKAAAEKVVVRRACLPFLSLPTSLKQALMDHSKWPHLKAVDWQEVAAPLLGLEHDVRPSDRRYNMIFKFQQNARDRMKKLAVEELEQPHNDES